MTTTTTTTTTTATPTVPTQATTGQTLRQARAAYFAASGFDESTYTARWVDVPVAGLRFRFPNIAARRAIVPLHDLHHALTGYGADLRGEGEIAAFEVGAGLGRHLVGWYLDLLTLGWAAWGLPRRSWRAFVRGRRTRGLYTHPLGPTELDHDLAAARAARGLVARARVRPSDPVLYAAAVAAGGFVLLASIPTALPAMLVLGLLGGARARGERAA